MTRDSRDHIRIPAVPVYWVIGFRLRDAHELVQVEQNMRDKYKFPLWARDGYEDG